jgi:hypothetical protein
MPQFPRSKKWTGWELNPRPKVSAPHVTTGLRNLPSGDSREDATLGSRVLIHSPRADYSSDGFREWLILQGKTRSTIKEVVNYAKKYGHILDTDDASWLAIIIHPLHIFYLFSLCILLLPLDRY